MEPSLPRVADSALMRLWRAKEKALASLGQPPVWGGCSQGGFTQGHRLLPFTLRSTMGGSSVLLVPGSMSSKLERASGWRSSDFGVKIISWSGEEAEQGGQPCQKHLPCLPILPEQGSSCQKFASHSAAVLCQIGHLFPTAPTHPSRDVPWGRGRGATRDLSVPWLELTGTG